MTAFGNSEPTNPEYIAYRDNCNTTNNSCVSCSAVTEYYEHLLRPVADDELPWTGIVFGLTVSAVWCWCTDQVWPVFDEGIFQMAQIRVAGHCSASAFGQRHESREGGLHHVCRPQSDQFLPDGPPRNGRPRPLAKYGTDYLPRTDQLLQMRSGAPIRTNVKRYADLKRAAQTLHIHF